MPFGIPSERRTTMKKRILALFLIILLLTAPVITGVFAASEPPQETEVPAAESTQTPETEPDTEAPEAPPATEAPEAPPATEEPDTGAPTEPIAPPETEEPTDPEPQEFSDFAPDLEPTGTQPGREIAHGLTDPTEVRYRYYWVLRLHSADDGSFTEVKAYIRAQDGSEVFSSEPEGETEAIVSRPEDPVRAHAEFLGWYTAEDVEFRFEDETVITSHLELYAKWDELRGEITIRRRLDSGETQSFWYMVEGDDGSLIRVAIPAGKSSVTITGVKIGVTYKVTEAQGWSWRYSCKKQVQNAVLSDEMTSVTLTFEGEKRVTKWLSAIAQLIKTVKEG